MKLQKQINQWSCVLYSVAMCLNINAEDLIKIIGHDGSEILFKDKLEPYNRRSFYIEEFASIIYNRGYCLMPFVKCGEINDNFIQFNCDPPLHRQGILMYGRHAVAWDGNQIYNPSGSIDYLKPHWDVFWLLDIDLI